MRLIKKIFDLKIKPTLNNKLIITLSLIAINGCSSFSNQTIENEEDVRIKALNNNKIKKMINDQSIKKVIFIPNKILNIVLQK